MDSGDSTSPRGVQWPLQLFVGLIRSWGRVEGDDVDGRRRARAAPHSKVDRTHRGIFRIYEFEL